MGDDKGGGWTAYEKGVTVDGRKPKRPGWPEEHGGRAAMIAINKGLPFKEGSTAALEELAVREQLESQGHRSMFVENAARLQVVARLYWSAIMADIEAGDLEQLDTHVQTFVKVTSRAGLAWASLATDEREQARGTLDELLRPRVVDGTAD